MAAEKRQILVTISRRQNAHREAAAIAKAFPEKGRKLQFCPSVPHDVVLNYLSIHVRRVI